MGTPVSAHLTPGVLPFGISIDYPLCGLVNGCLVADLSPEPVPSPERIGFVLGSHNRCHREPASFRTAGKTLRRGAVTLAKVQTLSG